MPEHRIYSVSFASVYPHYVAKAEKKQRTRAEVDQIIRWLTGYSQKQLEGQIKTQTNSHGVFQRSAKPQSRAEVDHGGDLWRACRRCRDPLMQECPASATVRQVEVFH
jgi:hypothetical protein